MPVELTSLDEFKKVAERAVECRIKKSKKSKIVKIKARTRRYLYTIKVEEDNLEKVLENLPCKKLVYVDEGKVVEKK